MCDFSFVELGVHVITLHLSEGTLDWGAHMTRDPAWLPETTERQEEGPPERGTSHSYGDVELGPPITTDAPAGTKRPCDTVVSTALR